MTSFRAPAAGLPLLEGLPQRLGPPELLGWVGKPGHKVAELVPQGAVVYVSWVVCVLQHAWSRQRSLRRRLRERVPACTGKNCSGGGGVPF